MCRELRPIFRSRRAGHATLLVERSVRWPGLCSEDQQPVVWVGTRGRRRSRTETGRRRTIATGRNDRTLDVADRDTWTVTAVGRRRSSRPARRACRPAWERCCAIGTPGPPGSTPRARAIGEPGPSRTNSGTPDELRTDTYSEGWSELPAEVDPQDRGVETRGIEPLTPALQRRCSAN